MPELQSNSLPLFQKFPALAQSVPWIHLANLPTPVQPFNTPETSATPLSNLWIKRDDKSSDLYGGNKVRKLEFVLAEVIQQGKTKLLTFGAIGTNHGVATALFCQKYGIKCKVLLFDQPVTKTVQDNLKLMQCFEANLEYKGSLFRTVLHFYLARLLGKSDTYTLFAGGSNLAGCIGFVNAAFELKQQIKQKLIPEPDFIYCPVGSNATAAGLSLGCKLAGLKSRVVGVRVAPAYLGIFPVCTSGAIHSLMASTYKYLKQQDSSIPAIKLPKINLEEQYFGAGYGHPLEEGTEATELFAQAGITLEPTYTAKTAAAVLKQCAEQPDKNILYWHTYNSADMSKLLSRVDVKSLPVNLRHIAKL
ncbi:MAG: pyridoxal-phosphate dependent enzyme [Proteobacteria bacterium]|nr:pyridoxal-phosphate dependent enzyme [Pseudomonadota bacterium]